MATFGIEIQLPRGVYPLTVEVVSADTRYETLKVTGSKGSFLLRSNRPALLAKGAAKAITWELLHFPHISPAAVEPATYALFSVMRALDVYFANHQCVLQVAGHDTPDSTPTAAKDSGQLSIF